MKNQFLCIFNDKIKKKMFNFINENHDLFKI